MSTVTTCCLAEDENDECVDGFQIGGVESMMSYHLKQNRDYCSTLSYNKSVE